MIYEFKTEKCTVVSPSLAARRNPAESSLCSASLPPYKLMVGKSRQCPPSASRSDKNAALYCCVS